MDPLTLTLLIGGITALIGSIGGGISQAVGSTKQAQSAVDVAKAEQEAIMNANATNLQMNRENNALQVMLANTAHQREVADLHKAGLNPFLSASGSGAVVANTQAGQVQPASAGVSANGGSNFIQGAVASGIGAMLSSVGDTSTDATKAAIMASLFKQSTKARPSHNSSRR